VTIDEVAELAVEQDPPEDHEAREPWVITSDEEANRALRRLRKAQNRADQIRSMAYAEITPLRREILRLEAWMEERIRIEAEADIEFFHGVLERYLRERRASDPKVKSLNLPQGVIGSREVPASWHVSDQETFHEWVQANLRERVGLTRVVVAPDAKALKQHIVKTGEVPPGVTEVEARWTVTVTPAAGDVPEQGTAGERS
jgi:phage host-nuclease inhibitor protein Gam